MKSYFTAQSIIWHFYSIRPLGAFIFLVKGGGQHIREGGLINFWLQKGGLIREGGGVINRENTVHEKNIQFWSADLHESSAVKE